MRYSWAILIGCVVLCLLAGGIGGFATQTGPESWYAGIAKPSFNPPNWVFAPVWTTLYIMIGVALYLAIRAKAGRRAFIAFGSQLAINTIWTFLFFRAENPELALAGIIVLLVTIVWTIIEFRKASRPAAWLFAPYLAWVTFATVLTAAIAVLN